MGALSTRAELPANALPTGGDVVAGQATFTQSGNALTINQSSAKAILDWQQFNIGESSVVNFHQPDANSTALNRVLGSDPSAIYGKLSANGQVFLINPNGVLFGSKAQVNVGGLVASTLSIQDDDFLNGNYHFIRDGSDAAVVNQGDLMAKYIALMAPEVRNEGVVTAHMGTVALAAGDAVNLSITGDALIDVQVEKATVDTLVENKHLIEVGGGTAVLAAQSANALIGSVVNSGVVEANSITTNGGVIRLSASHSLQQTGNLSANADMTGEGGSIVAIADASNPNSVAQISGSLSATGGSENGDGGFIETSAGKLSIADTARIDTSAANGVSGKWLLDPVDFTVAASAGDISGAALSAALANNDVTIQTAVGTDDSTDQYGETGTNGDIFVNDSISWSSNQKLTLSADRNIQINAPISATGGSGSGLSLEFGQGKLASDFTNASTYFVRAPIELSSNSSFSTKFGSDGSVTNFTVITDTIGLAGIGANSTTLTGKYVLGSDITASTDPWVPIADGSTTVFDGVFDGLGHTIDGLTRTNTDNASYVGLFGSIGMSGLVQNLGLTNVNVAGLANVGGLAGENNGRIYNAYVTGTVTGSDAAGVGSNTGTNDDTVMGIGGLVGQNFGGIANSYSAANVTATTGSQSFGEAADGGVGGLVGIHGSGTIGDSYATGSVNGVIDVGGLVGFSLGSVNYSYARGPVTGTTNVGGVVGGMVPDFGFAIPGLLDGTFWDTENTGQSSSASDSANSSTGLTSADAKMQASYSGFDFTNTWVIREDSSYPLLRSMLTPLYITADDKTKTFDNTKLSPSDFTATFSSGTSASDPKLSGTLAFTGTAVDAVNAGTYTITPGGLTIADPTDQHGYLSIDYIDSSLNINKVIVMVKLSGNKVYDGTTDLTGVVTIDTGNSDTLNYTDASAASKDVSFANNYVTAITLQDGTGLASNYELPDLTTWSTDNNVTITPADLTLSGTRQYDATSTVAGSILTATGVNGETFSVTGSGDSSNLLDKNVQSGSALNSVSGLALGDSSNDAVASNYNGLSVTGSSISITKADLFIFGSRPYDTSLEVDGDALRVDPSVGMNLFNATDYLIAGNGTTNEFFNLTGKGTIANKDAGATQIDSLGTLAIHSPYSGTSAALASNYNLKSTGSFFEVKKANIALAASRQYDGTTDLTGAVTIDTGNSETLTYTNAVAASKDVAFANNYVSSITLQDGTGVASNYALPDLTDFSDYNKATITPADLVLSGSRQYDGSTLTAGSILTAKGLNGETFSVTGNGDASNLLDKNVQTNSALSSVTGLAIGSSSNGGVASNYRLSTANSSIDITPREIVAGLISSSDHPIEKVYDGTDTASISFPDNFSYDTTNYVPGEFVVVDANAKDWATAGTYDNKNVGTDKTVTLMLDRSAYLPYNSNTDVNNYVFVDALTGATDRLTGNVGVITKKDVTIDNVTIATREYNGSATFTTQSIDFSGIVASDVDSITFTVQGTFDNKNAGSNKVATIATTSISGSEAGNYNLLPIDLALNLFGTITAKTITLTAPAISKVYDATTNYTTEIGDLAGLNGDLVSGDTVTGASLAFADKNAGTGKTVLFEDITINDGNNGANYMVDLKDGTNGTITKKELILTGISATKEVDGTTNVTSISGQAQLLAAVAPGSGSSNDFKPYSGDTVSLNEILASDVKYRSAEVGTDIPLDLKNTEKLSGADAHNYMLVDTTESKGVITVRTIRASDVIGSLIHENIDYSNRNSGNPSLFDMVTDKNTADLLNHLYSGFALAGLLYFNTTTHQDYDSYSDFESELFDQMVSEVTNKNMQVKFMLAVLSLSTNSETSSGFKDIVNQWWAGGGKW